MLKHLKTSFEAVPNRDALHLTALVSSAKPIRSLFPYTTQHPKCLQIDYLVTLGCEVDAPPAPDTVKSATTAATGVTATNDATKVESQVEEKGEGSGQGQGKKRVLTTALSAHLYILPQHRTSILYISKLDSSGYPTVPLPLTRTFITSILQYFLLPESRPTEHVRIQLFARSQGQYLFPNSSEGPKKVLGGLGLCGWWKGVYEDAAASAKDHGEVRLGMVLPGYSHAEAKGMLGQRKPLPEGLEWTSAPPSSNPLPSIAGPSTTASSSQSVTADTSAPLPSVSLANLIPSFPDDPKSRFLDDLVSDGAEDPQRRRKLLGENPSSSSVGSSTSASGSGSGSGSKRQKTESHKGRMQAEDEAERRFTQATLEKVSPGEYWERMGFRQECISGDVTGFFTLESTTVARTTTPAKTNQDTPAPTNSGPQVSAPIPIATPPATTNLPPDIVNRLLRALLNTDFKSYTHAIDHTAVWDRAVHSVVIDEIGEEGYEACKAKIPGKVIDADQPVMAPIKRKEEQVTVLQVRKKKKAV